MIYKRNLIDYKFACCSNEDNLNNVVVIDQRAGFDVCLNHCGWPANEISLLMKLQRENLDSPLISAIENSLYELPAPHVDNSGLTDSEIAARVIPKYVGTLSEYLSWVESLPLSASERALLDQQAKEQYGDEEFETTPVVTGGESS